jgi:hypothetical protein
MLLAHRLVFDDLLVFRHRLGTPMIVMRVFGGNGVCRIYLLPPTEE